MIVFAKSVTLSIVIGFELSWSSFMKNCFCVIMILFSMGYLISSGITGS